MDLGRIIIGRIINIYKTAEVQQSRRQSNCETIPIKHPSYKMILPIMILPET